MLIQRIYLRNFRVYEDELNLEVPPGLVGIYGPNGSGKSTLLEAILFTLWGKARTTKEQIRSSGVGGDCVTEVEFEHEGHLYLVRRTLKGINSQVSVEAHCDGALMSTGTRDAERFVQSVLGMDDGAFRASVFTEQKQLAAFSNQTPAERRRLVLQLLGITPLDGARDAARKDARDLTAAHDRMRGLLADVAVLETEAADAAARADASDRLATDEAGAAATAKQRADEAAELLHRIDVRRQEHEALVIEGRAAREEMERAEQAVTGRVAELREVDELASRLTDLDAAAAGLEPAEQLLELLLPTLASAESAERAASSGAGERPPSPDEASTRAAADRSDALKRELSAAAALCQAADAESERAAIAATRSRDITGDGECPTCGQSLGESFKTVQAHRAAELAQAQARATELAAQVKRLTMESKGAEKAATAAAQAETAAHHALAAWEDADRRRTETEAVLRRAWERADNAGAAAILAPGPPGRLPGHRELQSAVETLRADVRRQREASGQALGIRARLEARPGIERSLTEATDRLATATSRVEVLREKVRSLDFRRQALDAASTARDTAVSTAASAAARAHEAALTAAADREKAAAAAGRLAAGRAQHEQIADLERDARHRGRAADLLSDFRNTVVASVGPRLAIHAAELFAELTDREYDRIDVDPETFQLQISDGGQLYGLDRFSGSEIDLANLALRVAISEHIHFQSGGSVGLLVLDEVFGPLDDDRKARMLLALERLRGRFRQVLVVTHDSEVKEQLPNAIEVMKRPGRRAVARVLDA